MNDERQRRDRYSRIFLPFAMAQKDRVLNEKIRFVYYTTAETAFSILKNREIWMRNTTTMNDFMEVNHGIKCLAEAYSSSPGQAFRAALNECFPGLANEVGELFGSWIPGIHRDTFIACLSEHSPSEDPHGRLSMWRAYGGNAGVAIVMNVSAILGDSDGLGAYASPVAYMDAQGISEQMERIAAALSADCEFVRTFNRDQVKKTVFHTLRFAAVSTKHPGFKEEQEWRIVAAPSLKASDLLPAELAVVRGIPQTILKLKLRNHPGRGLVGLEPSELIHKVIIGPCEYPDVITKAIVQLLAEAKVPEAHSKVETSRIPLRMS